MLLQGSLKPKASWKIGLVTSRFNTEITEKLETGAYERMLELGFKPEQLRRARVPGAVEIPLTAQALIDHGCDAVIALGAVIRGETTHYESVCQAVERGCMQVMLHAKKPVIFGVLTTENEDQALARLGGAHGHKGRDAADTVVEMLNLLESI